MCDVLGNKCSLGYDGMHALGMPSEDSMADIRRTVQDYKAATRTTYLFLDDYQAWNSEYAAAIIDVMSTHQVKGLHVIIASHPFDADNLDIGHMPMPAAICLYRSALPTVAHAEFFPL